MVELKVDKVYVLHVKKGYEARKKMLMEQFDRHGITAEFMLDGDMEDITPEQLDHYFKGDMHMIKPITSCTIKHFYILEKMVTDGVEDALIFEDDAILEPSFNRVFNASVEEFKKRTDIDPSLGFVSFENSTLKFVPSSQLVKGQYLYEANNGRCLGAYYLTTKLAKKMMDYTLKNKCGLPSDWHYDEMLKNGVMKIYWCHPAIVEQGSHNGLFASGIDGKKYGTIRRVNWKFQKWYKQLLYKFR